MFGEKKGVIHSRMYGDRIRESPRVSRRLGPGRTHNVITIGRRSHPKFFKIVQKSTKKSDMNRYFGLQNEKMGLKNRYDSPRKPTFQVDMNGVKLSI